MIWLSTNWKWLEPMGTSAVLFVGYKVFVYCRWLKIVTYRLKFEIKRCIEDVFEIEYTLEDFVRFIFHLELDRSITYCLHSSVKIVNKLQTRFIFWGSNIFYLFSIHGSNILIILYECIKRKYSWHVSVSEFQ